MIPKILCIWPHWVSVAAWAFPLAVESRVCSLVAPRHLTAAVSLAAELEPWSARASAVLTRELRSRGSWAVGHRFSGCGA